MFYPVDSLKRGGRFYLCWVADSWPLRFATITHRQLWSQDIRVICEDLLEVIMNESGRPTRRFSLRLSSQLLRGLVRLYQRKVNIFLGELCRINVNVFKSAYKKRQAQDAEPVRRVRRAHAQLDIQEIIQLPNENEQAIVEMIQASGNAVAHIADITLREPEPVTDLLLKPNDGFGEENPDQPFQHLQDRTLELMLVRADVTGPLSGLSGLELGLDVTDKSHDKTRLPVHDARMERISDHELTMFRKSTVGDLEFEKDIPEITEIPPPELPAPEPEKIQEQEIPEQSAVTSEPPKKPEPDFQLEELQELPPAKRRKLRKLIVDKTIKISTQQFRARIENPRVELRCEDSSQDIIFIHVTPESYFRRPCHGGQRIDINIGFELSRLFGRNLGVSNVQPYEEREIEEVLHAAERRRTRSQLPRIEEEHEIPIVTVAQVHQVVQQLHITDMSAGPLLDISERPSIVPQVEPDIADMLTQKVETLSQQRKRRAQDVQNITDLTPKRQRSVGFVSYRESQLTKLASQDADQGNKENRPDNIQPIPTMEVAPPSAEKIVSSMLQEAGLADIPVQPPVMTAPDIQVSQRVSRDKHAARSRSDSSETQLGSLDRTKVSLGDSELTTDSKRFIRDQWGTEGTMLKILKYVKTSNKPVTVRNLIENGPIITGHIRVIAARCFNSVLKLKQHGFIYVSKDQDTLEIRNIALGPKLVSSQEQI